MNNRYEILTPSGFKDFHSVSIRKAKDVYTLYDDSGNSISATLDHMFYTAKETWIAVKDIQIGTKLFNGTIISINKKPGEHDVYDIMQIKDVHCFNSSGFIPHNSFVGSCATLLRPDTLSRIDRDCLKPIQTSKQTAIFKEPLWGHKYIATVDCADTGDDASTISIIDITNYPYEQVARFKDNKISHLSFPQIIMNFAAKYNMADVLVESNDVGKVILHILNYDIGYENIVSTKIGTRIGLGQRTTSKTKPIGCARLKDMLESGKMIIRDADTSTELKHFVLDGHSYAAEEGYHDDLVMGLVNLAYYANTSSFRYHHDSNFTDEYRKEYEESIMEMLTPLPMFSVDNEVDEEDLSFLRELRS